MGQPTSTQGTDRVVKSALASFTPGNGQVIVGAQPGILYRVVGLQVSLSVAGSVSIYHGIEGINPKYIAAGNLAAGVPLVINPGDWAAQNGANNENIQANVVTGNAVIVVYYIEISSQQ